MVFIDIVSPRRASGEAAEAYRYMAEMGGSRELIANVVQVFSLNPTSMRRMVRSWELTMWCSETRRADREFLAAAVSRLNECHY